MLSSMLFIPHQAAGLPDIKTIENEAVNVQI